MKNKKFLVIIATALMACLVVGMGAMTYSKYATNGQTGPQTATAAKWGFVVNVDATNLFGSDYTKGTTYAEVTTAGSGVAIKATSSANDIVAPGATGSMTFSVSGTAEVLAQISITGTVTSEICDGLGTDLANYPVKWTLKKDSAVVTGCENVKLATIIEKINTAPETKIQPNTSATNAGSYELSWAWAFYVDDATNVKDTVIGYKANGMTFGDDTAKDIDSIFVGTTQISTVYDATKFAAVITELSFSLSINVEQVQA